MKVEICYKNDVNLVKNGLNNNEKRYFILEWIDFAKDLRAEGYTYNQISKELFKTKQVDVSEEIIRYHIKRKNMETLSKKEKLAKDGFKKVLILNDIHCPFNLDILSIVEKHKNEISMIIFGGDTIDCEDVSSFPRVNKIPLIKEMIDVHSLLKKIDNMTPNVRKVVLIGNHEQRFAKYLALTNTKLNAMHSTNIMKEICNGFTYFDRDNDVESKFYPLKNYEVLDEWYFMVNDLIVCHPLSFSKINGRTAVSAVEFFLGHGHEFTAIAVAHTHKMASTIKYGKWCCETGCLCQEMEYANSGKLGFTPQDNGYMIATFYEGKFDKNESKTIYL